MLRWIERPCKLILERENSVLLADRTARSFELGSATTCPSRASIAWRVSSGISHDSASARASSRTSRVVVPADPPPEPPHVFRGLHS